MSTRTTSSSSLTMKKHQESLTRIYIWARLKRMLDTKILLTKKLQILAKCDLVKSRDPEKLVYAISTFTNILRETIQLAEKHKIEENLYYGDALSKNLSTTWWLTGGWQDFWRIADDVPNEKETWRRLLIFLEKEEKLQQQKSIINGCKNNNKDGMPSSKWQCYKVIQHESKKILLCSLRQWPTFLHLWRIFWFIWTSYSTNAFSFLSVGDSLRTTFNKNPMFYSLVTSKIKSLNLLMDAQDKSTSQSFRGYLKRWNQQEAKSPNVVQHAETASHASITTNTRRSV